MNLSDLFNPATFLGALRQQTARESNLSMDELKLVNSWSRGGINNAKIPVKVAGIRMEGALFDGLKLSECSWDSLTYSTTPTCTIAWKYSTNFLPEIFRRIFQFFGRIFLTYNLLTIASFRIKVPSILFKY